MSEIFYRIVVPTDFSPSSEKAWALAQRLATALESELLLVHVFTEAPFGARAPSTWSMSARYMPRAVSG
jgi:nucleotide-binding universal stress UspA family protein